MMSMLGLRKVQGTLRSCCNQNRLVIKALNHTSTNQNEEEYDDEPEKQLLYEDHVRINKFQRAALAFGSGLVSLFNPRRADMIAVFGETTGSRVLQTMYSSMLVSDEGSRIIVDKPRINSKTVDLGRLAALPAGTLGHAYTSFLEDNQVTPDSRLPVQFIDNPELAYVMQRYRETHDLAHTVLGMPTNMLGEVVVKWIEAFQTGLPMCINGAIFGASRLRPKQREKYQKVLLPWATRVGKTATPLMNIYYEERWEQELVDLRRELNVEEPPIL